MTSIVLVWDTCFILSVVCKSIANYVILEQPDPPLRFSNAFTACNNYNGTLVSMNQFQQHLDDIREQCNTTTGEYWIGDYSTLTPYLTLLGCYKYTTTVAASTNFTIIKNNVAKCQARCPNDIGIAVKNDQCQCVLRTLNITGNLTSLPVSECDIIENGEILGGHQDAMSIYVKDEAFSPDGDNMDPFCRYGNCGSMRGVYTARCSAKESATVVCLNNNDNLTKLNTASDWWTAMETCVNGDYGYLMDFAYFLNNRQEICRNLFNSKVWTTSRQYRSSIMVPDVRITDLEGPNTVCRTANMQSGLSNETGECNSASTLHGFICKAYKAMYINPLISANTSIRCIINITKASPVTTISPSMQTVGEDTRGSSTLDKSTSLGPVLVLAAIVIFLSIIAVAIVRRMKAKHKQNRSGQYEPYPSQYQNRQDDNDRYEALEIPGAANYEIPGNPRAATYEALGSPSESTYTALENPSAASYETAGNPSAATYEALGSPSESTYTALENPSAATYETAGNPTAATYEALGSPSESTYTALENPSAASYETAGNPSAATYEALGSPSESTYTALENPSAATYETAGNPTAATYEALENPSAAY